ncbi:MAG: hypothetical protein R3E79_52800 [Caldilineaceae bacterium]
MAEILNVRLTGRNMSASSAELTISWTTRFKEQEVLGRTVFIYDIYIKNVDDTTDPDVRHRRLGTAWNLASETPIDREVSYRVDRKFLDEDFQIGIPGFVVLGDTTDEWVAEIKARPFVPAEVTARSPQLRMEFGTSQ